MDIKMAIATWPAQAPRGSVAAFCRQHEISRSRFYEIRAQAVAEGPLVAVTAKARSRPDLAIPAAVAARALRIRRELAEDGWDHGPITVREAMLGAGLPAPSRSTLARIFTAAGDVVPAPRKRPKSSYRSFVFEQVHGCWQLDATEWRLADGSTVVIFQMIDDHSRYLLASVVAGGETGSAAVQVMTDAVAQAGQAPVLLLTDNGLAMNPHRRGKTSSLARYAASLGTRPITSRVYHPQTCGKNERVHSTLKKYLRARPLPATHDDLRELITIFEDYYNTRRPHQALQMKTPLQALADSKAPAPQPPPAAPAPARKPRTRRIPGRAQPTDRLRALRVNGTGSVKAARAFINLGAEHAGSQVLALIEPAFISIFDIHGTEIRTVRTEPSKTYYGTGRPGGGPRRPRRNDIITTTNPPTVRFN